MVYDGINQFHYHWITIRWSESSTIFNDRGFSYYYFIDGRKWSRADFNVKHRKQCDIDLLYDFYLQRIDVQYHGHGSGRTSYSNRHNGEHLNVH